MSSTFGVPRTSLARVSTLLALAVWAPSASAVPPRPGPAPVKRARVSAPAPGGSGHLLAHGGAAQGNLPSQTVVVEAPGTDTSLCMNFEPAIAVDPNDQKRIAVAQFASFQLSFDGGNSFPVWKTAPAIQADGDPSLAFDSQGRLFLTYICSDPALPNVREICISGYTCDAGTTSCDLLPGPWPVRLSDKAGLGSKNPDKEWLAADARTASAFRDRLYVTWTRFDTNPPTLWTTASSDQGQSWSAAQQLSSNDEGVVWASHLAVGADGAVYAAWHSQPGFFDPDNGRDVPDGVSGKAVLRRSTDGGATWLPRVFPFPAGKSDMTWNVQHEAHGVVPGATMWLFGSIQPWVLPDPLQASRLYVVAADDPDDNVDAGDAADVFIAASTDSGATWGNPRRVDQGPAGTFQIMPTAAINPVNGTIAVTYYDNRASSDTNVDGVFELDLLATISTDGGTTWSTEVDVNDGRLDPQRAGACRFCGSDAVTGKACSNTAACPAPRTTRIGEYNGAAFAECTLHMVWADNGTTSCGGDLNTYYDRDPRLGGDVTAPAITCPANAVAGCDEPTGPFARGTATATDACDPRPVVTYLDEILPGNCPTGKVVQTIERTWKATDAAGNARTCVQTITVEDTTAPTLSCAVTTSVLWPTNPPNHDPVLVDVGLTFSAADLCDTNAPAIAITVTSDEKTATRKGAGGDKCPDAVVTSDNRVLLRAERSGSGDGRVYRITVTATDACGNAATCSATVSVPQSLKGTAVDSGQLHDATRCN